MKYALGRYIYAAAAIGFGLCAFAFHDVSNWLQLKALAGAAHSESVAYTIGTIEILGGAAIAWPRTARIGALALGAMYTIFALLDVPYIIAHPLIYNGFGNFFEQLSLATGAAILASDRTERLAKIGYYAFGICVVSFGLEQLFYLSATAGFVPKWIPPGQMFWAVATTVAFFLASIALLSGIRAGLASALNTAMLLGFGLLVWVPALIADPHTFSNWTEGIVTLMIVGCSWIVTDYLRN
jgi:hypothetical protein